MRLREEWSHAVEGPRWAWRFYRAHLGVVVGLSLIPSVQRLIVVQGGERIPAAVALSTEVLVLLARLLLIAVIWRLAMPRRTLTWGTYPSEHWPALVMQGGLLVAATLVINLGLEQLVPGLLPESARQSWLAVVLFVKNPTVIAFTFIWVIGMVRRMLRPAAEDVAA